MWEKNREKYEESVLRVDQVTRKLKLTSLLHIDKHSAR